MITELNLQVQQSLDKNPPTESLKPIQLFDLQNDFVTVSRNCLGSQWTSFATFSDEYQKKNKLKSKATEIENFHVKAPDGKSYRIHIVQENSKKVPDVQLFILDPQNTTAPVALTTAQRQMPPEKLVEELKKMGTLNHHETKERWQFENGQVLVVTFENDQTQDFQLFTESKTFSCERDQCYCF